MIDSFFPSVSTAEDAVQTRRDGGLGGMFFAGTIVAFIAYGWYHVGTNPKLSAEAIAGARETLTGSLLVPGVIAALSFRIRMAPDRVCAWLLLLVSLAETIAWLASGPKHYGALMIRIPFILAAINGVRGAHASKRFGDAQIISRLF